MLAIGERAPFFVAAGTDRDVELRSLLETGPVVLYFFPQAMTGG